MCTTTNQQLLPTLDGKPALHKKYDYAPPSSPVPKGNVDMYSLLLVPQPQIKQVFILNFPKKQKS